MASPKKRTRSLTREDDEEDRLKKEPDLNEEYDRDRADRNEEAKTDDDDAKQEEEEDEIEKKKTESEDEDANQDDERSFLRNTWRRLTTPEELKARDGQDDMVAASFAMSHLIFLRDGETEEGGVNSEDDSELNLSLLSRWEIPVIPPEKIVNPWYLEQCSRPIRKQMTVSDVSGSEEQSRLTLSKSQVDKKFAHLLEEIEIPRGKGGIRVSVYGPDGKVHEMKMLADGEDSPDLTAGWRKFVGDYKLREYCDFVTIWMFRNKETHQICLAIDVKRLFLRETSEQEDL